MKSLRALMHEAVDRACDELEAQAKAPRVRRAPREHLMPANVDELTQQRALKALRRLGLA
jgi:hypothetical protein